MQERSYVYPLTRGQLGGVHSSFVEAVRSGDIKQVEALWHRAVSVSDWNRWHLLHLAAEQGDADILNFLLERGANINELNARRYAPLHLAAWGTTRRPFSFSC